MCVWYRCIGLSLSQQRHITEVWWCILQLVVEVMDANDHRPVFSAPLYEASVSEAVAPATTVLALQCRDKDQSPSTDSAVYFSLHHAEALASHGLFTVDSTAGDLIVAKPLDRLEYMSSSVMLDTKKNIPIHISVSSILRCLPYFDVFPTLMSSIV